MQDAPSEVATLEQSGSLIRPPIAQLDLDLKAFRQRCGEFSRLLPFARNPPRADPNIAEVRNGIEDIYRLVSDTHERFGKMIADLDKNMLGVKESMHIVPAWYEAGDLLCKPFIR